MGNTVCERTLDSGHRIQVSWGGAQTARPTGALDGSAPKRTRYFFEVLIDDLYYYGNRFVTSPDAESLLDSTGTPILARTDIILGLCADRVAQAISDGNINSLPNDLGQIEVSELVERAGNAY